MKNFQLSLLIFIFLIGAEQLFAFQLPESWINPPEFQINKIQSDDVDLDELGANLLGVLQGQEDILKYSDSEKGKRWYLKELRTGLAVGIKGSIGVRTIKGEDTIRFTWKKRSKKTKGDLDLDNFNTTSTPNSTSSDINPTMNDSVLINQEEYDYGHLSDEVESIVNKVMATGKVNDKANLELNLTKSIKNFESLFMVLNEQPSYLSWWPYGARLDLSVDVSGKVTPFATVGGGLRLRFEWYRMMKKPSTIPKANDNTVDGLKSKSLYNFLYNMSQDLSIASENAFDGVGYRPYSMRIGVAIGAGGSVHVAKLSGAVMAYIMFKKNQNKVLDKLMADKLEFNKDVGEYSLLHAPNELELSYAKNNKIEHHFLNNDKMISIPGVVYRISRNKFRSGLRKGLWIAKFFAKQATRLPQRNWYIAKIQNDFLISLSGGFSMVKLTGTVDSRMTFVKN